MMIKQKLLAVLAVVIAYVTTKITGDGTLALLFIPLAIGLFFSKHNWLND